MKQNGFLSSLLGFATTLFSINHAYANVTVNDFKWQCATTSVCATVPAWSNLNTEQCERIVYHEFGADPATAKKALIMFHGQQGPGGNAENGSIVAGAKDDWNCHAQDNNFASEDGPHKFLNDPALQSIIDLEDTYVLLSPRPGICAGIGVGSSCGNSGNTNQDIMQGWREFISARTNSFANVEDMIWIGASMGGRTGFHAAHHWMNGPSEYDGNFYLVTLDAPLMNTANDLGQGSGGTNHLHWCEDNPLEPGDAPGADCNGGLFGDWEARRFDINLAFGNADKNKFKALNILGGWDVTGNWGLNIHAAYGEVWNASPSVKTRYATGCFGDDLHRQEAYGGFGSSLYDGWFVNEWTTIKHDQLTGDSGYGCHTLDPAIEFVSHWMGERKPRLKDRDLNVEHNSTFELKVNYGKLPFQLLIRDADTKQVVSSTNQTSRNISLYANWGAGSYDVEITDSDGDRTFGQLRVRKTTSHFGDWDNAICRNLGSSVLSSAIGDHDQDGRSDMVASLANGQLQIWELNAAADDFNYSPSVLLNHTAPRNVRYLDVDQDNQLDLVFTEPSVSGKQDRIQYYLGKDQPWSSADLRYTAMGNWLTAQRYDAADIDGDGDIDLVVGATTTGTEFRYCAFENDNFSCSGYWPSAMKGYADLALADINNDGFIDVVATSGGDDRVVIHSGQAGGGGSSQFSKDWNSAKVLNYNSTYGTTALEVGDLNEDGLLDIALMTPTDGVVSFYGSKQATLTFSPANYWKPTHLSSWQGNSLQLADMGIDNNGEAGLDMVIGPKNRNLNNNQTTVLLAPYSNSGYSSLTSADSGVSSYNWQFAQAIARDTNNDGYMDIAYGTRNSNLLCINQYTH